MIIDIDPSSGFCFGVVRAISTAEKELTDHSHLYCLGDIVHNGQEVERLRRLGLDTTTIDRLDTIAGSRVLLRAHGEPPSTYAKAEKNSIEIVDATCPVVLNLQRKIKASYLAHPDAQIVIYGKHGHAEVIGLEGQTDGNAIVVEGLDEIDRIDMSRPVILFSQTTKSIDGLTALVEKIKSRLAPGIHFEYHDTICRQVANRIPNIRRFAARYDVILFVAGAKSSNGKILYHECLNVNPRARMISSADEIDFDWLEGATSIGICGATSTPKWLMEEVKQKAESLLTAESEK